MELTRKQSIEIRKFITEEAKEIPIEKQYALADKICEFLEEGVLKEIVKPVIPMSNRVGLTQRDPNAPVVKKINKPTRPLQCTDSNGRSLNTPIGK